MLFFLAFSFARSDFFTFAKNNEFVGESSIFCEVGNFLKRSARGFSVKLSNAKPVLAQSARGFSVEMCLGFILEAPGGLNRSEISFKICLARSLPWRFM